MIRMADSATKQPKGAQPAVTVTPPKQVVAPPISREQKETTVRGNDAFKDEFRLFLLNTNDGYLKPKTVYRGDDPEEIHCKFAEDALGGEACKKISKKAIKETDESVSRYPDVYGRQLQGEEYDTKLHAYYASFVFKELVGLMDDATLDKNYQRIKNLRQDNPALTNGEVLGWVGAKESAESAAHA